MDVLTLLSLAKTLVDTLRGIRDLATAPGDRTPESASVEKIKEASEAFTLFRERLAKIVVQLEQSEELIHLLPVWQRDYDEIDVWKTELDNQDVVNTDRRLRNLVRDSLIDHFSGLTQKEKFPALSGVPSKIEEFRTRLEALQQDLDGIPHGNAEVWRLHWPTLKVRLGDIRDQASKIEMDALAIHTEQIREISEATVADL